MPGQFQKYGLINTTISVIRTLSDHIVCRLQEQYAQEFTIFKPDKKLRWLPHLGTVHLELQLEDRVMEVDVPPLEAAFIELFSNKSKLVIIIT
jgi:hypothetical protein